MTDPTQANALSTNWGQVIFQSANEMVNNIIIRERVAEIQAKAEVDRERWEKERAEIKTQFMKELEEDAGSAAPKKHDSDKANSDEDAVLVEGGGPGTSGSAVGSKGSARKKKGKK